MLEILIEYFPWILLAVFGAFAYFVEDVRITSSVIVVTALINMAMGSIYEDGTTLVFLYKGAIDTMTALTLLLIYGTTSAKKAPEQAIIFVLFAFSHGWLVYEVFLKEYYFYDYYDATMWGLTAAHFLVMGDYYEELYKRIKDVLGRGFNGLRFGWSFNRGLAHRKHGIDSVGSSSRGRDNGSSRSVQHNHSESKG